MAKINSRGYRMDKPAELEAMKEIDRINGQHQRPSAEDVANEQAKLIEAMAENQPANRIRSVEDKLDKITEQLNTIIMLMKHPAPSYQTPEDNARRMRETT